MHVMTKEPGLPGLDVPKTRLEIIDTIKAARQSGNLFLIYLLSMVIEELANIESGQPTEL
jgi:hypothetical protein